MDENVKELTQSVFDDNFEISEKDFYPPEDKRVLRGLQGNHIEPITEYRQTYFNYIDEFNK